MMRNLLLRLVLLLALLEGAHAQEVPQAYLYDADSLTYTCPHLCSSLTGDCRAQGAGISVSKPVTTSGVASTTVTSVDSDSPFAGVSKGDVLLLDGVIDATTLLRAGQALRRVDAVASANSVTVDSAVLIPSAGAGFRWWRTVAGTDADAGYWSPGSITFTTLVGVEQISVTGGVDWKMECRDCYGGVCTAPVTVQATTNLTATGGSAKALSDTAYDQCRVCLKVGTTDDDTVSILAGVSDAIDFAEFTDSFTVGAAEIHLDFVEDAGGAPKVCVATAVAGTYTGAALATHMTGAMLDAACVPGNTYAVSYSSTTHKFTIARTAGATTVDLLWQTGANTATSIKGVMGYDNTDDTGSLSYVSDIDSGSAELNATVAGGLYATGAEACTAVAAAMNAVAIDGTHACSFSTTTNKFTISASGLTDLWIWWDTGTNNATAADTPLGFSADVTGAISYTGAAITLDGAADVEQITIAVRK